MSTNRKQQLLDYLKAEPDSSFLLFALAKEYETEQKTSEAIITYETLLVKNPNYTGAYYHLGKQYVLSEQTQKAIEIYLKGIEICKSTGATHDASELRAALEDLTDY